MRCEASPKLLTDRVVGLLLLDELGPLCDCFINSLPFSNRLKAVLDLGLISSSAGILMVPHAQVVG